MTTIAIGDKYVEALKPFGSLEDAVNLALQRYAIEQVTAKMADLRRRDAVYQAKYGMSYPVFARRAGVDEAFEQVEYSTEKSVPNMPGSWYHVFICGIRLI